MGPGVSRGRILVADDETALRDLYAELLTEAGYSATACSDGRAAVDALRKDQYDAVFSDIRMPDMDGLRLLAAVREMDLDLPVVLLTGTPSVQTAVDAIDRGALQYLIKPFSQEKLLEVAHRAVKLGRLARIKREALLTMGLDQLVGDRAGLEGTFARALGSLWMAYQPIVRAADGSAFGSEALVRTAEPLFPHPGAFLGAAERLRRLPDLGRAIRGAVATALASPALTGTVFVNLHPMDLADDSLLDSGSPLAQFASRVVLEVTERASLDSVADVRDRIGALRKLGYRVAIDDLGAGYAGLNNFARLTPDVVKLDMSLIRGLDAEPIKRKLVGSMASLCREMGMLVVAEGVETEAERAAVTHAGCDLLQGFLIGRPSRI